MKKILVVDDRADLKEILSSFLKDAGYDVVEAGNGAQAALLLNKELPDLVITDVEMPGGMSGDELVKYIRSEFVQPIKIIVFSGSQNLEVHDRAFAAGCDVFMEKPFKLDELFQAVKRLVG